MVPMQMRARRNRKIVSKNPDKSPQQQNGKQVWLSFELVELLAVAKLPGERSLGAVAERLLQPVFKAHTRHRPVNDLTRRFKTLPQPPLPPKEVKRP